MYYYKYWIIDNDSKGLTGRGTLYECCIKIDGIKHQRIYSIMDQIENNLVWQEIQALIKLGKESYQRIQEQRNSEFELNRQVNKKAQEDSKISNIKITKDIRDAINIVLQEHKQLVEQYKAGSEKSLNSLVGKILTQCKKTNVVANPFDVSYTLKQEL